MLDNEARKLLMEALDEQHNVKEVAEYFSVDISTVYRLLEQKRKTGSIETRTYLRGRKPALSEADIRNIRSMVEEQPNITLRKIIEILELHVCVETVRRALMKMGYIYEKIYFRTGRQEPSQCGGQEEGMEPSYIWVKKNPDR